VFSDLYKQLEFSLCMTVATAAAAGDIACTSQITNVGGNYDGASGTISAALQSGYSVAGQWSTTTSTEVGVGMTTSIDVRLGFPLSLNPRITADKYNLSKVGVPDLGLGFKEELSTTFTTTNTESSSSTSTINQLETLTYLTTVPKGAACSMQINVTTCTIKTSVQVPITFSGAVKNHFVSLPTHF